MAAMSAVAKVAVAAAALSLVSWNPAAAQGYPTQPVRIVVPVPPGPAADVLPRLIAEKLSARFGRPVLVENRPGANSNVGARAVAAAGPDGHTLLATPPPPLVVNQSLYPELGFDPAAFVPVTVIAALANVLVVNPDAPFASLAEMVAFARANPRKLTYASAGIGSGPHLAVEWLGHLAGIELTHVPYNGLAQALADVVAGRVDLMFNNTFNVLPHIREGRLRPLGVDSGKRIAAFPDLAAIAESFPGYEVTTWFAIVAPPQTPPAIAVTLSAAVAAALKEPDVENRLRDFHAVPVGSTPDEAAAFIARERERWHGIVTAAGIKLK